MNNAEIEKLKRLFANHKTDDPHEYEPEFNGNGRIYNMRKKTTRIKKMSKEPKALSPEQVLALEEKVKNKKIIKEFMDWLLVIVVLPVLGVLFDCMKNFMETGTMSWSPLIWLLVYTIGPAIVAYIKKNLMIKEREKDEIIRIKEDEITALKINAELYKQLLAINKISIPEIKKE